MSEIKKIFYSMGEVSEMLDVNPSLLRFWEKKFDILRPKKNKKGNRMFTPEDVRNLKIIYHLVKENGMTLAGAQKRLKQNRADIEREMELSERLHALKATLLEIKQLIGDDDSEAGTRIILQSEEPYIETFESIPPLEKQEADIAGQTKGTTHTASGKEIPKQGFEPQIETDTAGDTVCTDTEVSEQEFGTPYDEDAAVDDPTFETSEQEISEEDLEQEVEMAFAAEAAEDEVWDDECEELPEDEYDELPDEDKSPSCEASDNGYYGEKAADDEPETEIIMEEGMLFAVEAIKPKPVTDEPDKETEPEEPAREDEGPKIIEQTLF